MATESVTPETIVFRGKTWVVSSSWGGGEEKIVTLRPPRPGELDDEGTRHAT